MRPFQDPRVARVFETYPPKLRDKLLTLRELILDVAEENGAIGKIEETLKWGEPAYLTSETGSGSTLRMDWKKAQPKHYALYFHCQTNLVETFRRQFPVELRFERNRAVVFHEEDDVPLEIVAQCISAALTYHLQASPRKPAKRRRPGAAKKRS